MAFNCIMQMQDEDMHMGIRLNKDIVQVSMCLCVPLQTFPAVYQSQRVPSQTTPATCSPNQHTTTQNVPSQHRQCTKHGQCSCPCAILMLV
jgi:hypothetical protein